MSHVDGITAKLQRSKFFMERRPRIARTALAPGILEYAVLSSRHADRQRLTVRDAKLDDVRAVILRTVDHDPVLAVRHHCQLSLPQSSSAPCFTAGASCEGLSLVVTVGANDGISSGTVLVSELSDRYLWY